MDTDRHATARRLRELVEPISSGVYFAPEAQQRYEALGLNYFEGYFCSRSACIGKLPWRVVTGVFAAFNPTVVERAITGGWEKTEVAPLLDARLEGAREQLLRLFGEVPADANNAADILLSLTEDLDQAGRPIFAGLRGLPVPDRDDPIGRLWRATDLVREHRGDGHIAAWISEVDAVEISTLTELWWGLEPGSYVWTRGWDNDAVSRATDRLQRRGLLTDTGSLTPAGQDLREDIERRTDQAERDVLDLLGDRSDDLFAMLRPWAKAVVDGGGYPADPTKLFG
jgi:hypothetical protein